jgi:hypothetical protein
MNANEIGNAVKDMNRQDLDVIRNIVEERSAVLRKQEVDSLVKTVALGTYASYLKGSSEILGEVVAMTRKSVVLEVSKGDRVSKKTLAWEDIKKSYRTRQEANMEPPVKNLKQPTK